MLGTAYIVSGGELDKDLLLKVMLKRKDTDIVVAADSGLRFLDELNIKPDFILGDFDSLEKEVLEKYSKTVEVSKYNAEKDFSDTELAVELCIKKGFRIISILGCFGRRMDHSLANINMLCKYLKEDVHISLIDRYNKLYLIDKGHIIERDNMWGKYLAIFPMKGVVKDFSISGVKYPLKNVILDKYENPSFTISNELTEDRCSIEFTRGMVLVVESKDF